MGLFYNFKHSEVVEKVTMKWPCDDYIIPAGTPMSRTGIANNGDAIGILASEARVQFDFPLSVAKHIGKKEPKGNKDFTFEIITGGFVNLTDAESAFGEKYTDEAKAAMSGISFVDESGEGMGGGASSWNDLKDKPFYEEATEGVILEAELTDGMAQLAMAVELAEGKTYTVNLDSGSVQAVCKVLDMGGASLTYLGNLGMMEPGAENTGETFLVATSKERNMCAAVDANGGSKVSVFGQRVTVHKMEEKYLPQSVSLMKDGYVPFNQVVPEVWDVFGDTLRGSTSSTLSNQYPNKKTLSSLSVETFNGMLDGSVYLPHYVMEQDSLAIVSLGVDYISVKWSNVTIYAKTSYEVAGARMVVYSAKIHEDADNPGTIISECAMVEVANKTLS